MNEYGNQFNQLGRAASMVKSEMEEYLRNKLLGDYPLVKVGDPIYKVLSDAIEALNEIASREKQNYEDHE